MKKKAMMKNNFNTCKPQEMTTENLTELSRKFCKPGGGSVLRLRKISHNAHQHFWWSVIDQFNSVRHAKMLQWQNKSHIYLQALVQTKYIAQYLLWTKQELKTGALVLEKESPKKTKTWLDLWRRCLKAIQDYTMLESNRRLRSQYNQEDNIRLAFETKITGRCIG